MPAEKESNQVVNLVEKGHGSSPGDTANAPCTCAERIDKEAREPRTDRQRVYGQAIAP